MSNGRDHRGRFSAGHRGIGGRSRAPAGLARALRENWPPEQIAWWLREVIAGRDPERPADARPLDWPTRMRAMKMWLDRALGQPTQSIHLDAELALGAASPVPPASAFGALAPAERDALRHGLRALLVAGGEHVARQAVRADEPEPGADADTDTDTDTDADAD